MADPRLDELENAVSDAVDTGLLFTPDAETPSATPAPAPAAAPAAAPVADEGTRDAAPQPLADDEPILSETAAKLLDKFDGDLDKAANWAFETNNRAAEMHRRNQELERQIREGSRPPTDRPSDQPPQETPSSAELSEELRSIGAEKSDLVAANVNVRRALDNVNNSIDDLTNRKAYWVRQIINPTTNTNPDQIRDEIAALDHNLAGLEGQRKELTNWQNLARQAYGTYERQERLIRRLDSITSERASERQESETQQVSDFRDTYFSTVDSVAQQSGISARDLPAFREFARRSAVAYLYDTDDKTRITNTGRFVQRLASEWTGSANSRARQQLAAYTRSKVGDARGGRGTVSPGSAPRAPGSPASPSKPMTPQERMQALRDRIENEVDEAHEAAYNPR